MTGLISFLKKRKPEDIPQVSILSYARRLSYYRVSYYRVSSSRISYYRVSSYSINCYRVSYFSYSFCLVTARCERDSCESYEHEN